MNAIFRILLIDDDPDLRCAYALLLQRSGYEVAEAATGEQGLLLAQAFLPDLILLDAMLPDTMGAEVCQRLKAQPQLANCLVVMISSRRVSTEEKVEGLELGADDYITRPISNRELLARIQSMQRLKQAEARVWHLNRVLVAIHKISQVMIRETDRQQLLSRVCQILVEAREYSSAWIALLDEAGRLFQDARAGFGDELLPDIERLTRGELIACEQQALAQEDVVIVDEPASECLEAYQNGEQPDRVGMIVRLAHIGRIYGFLTVSGSAVLADNQEEHNLIREIAADIAFALHGIESNEKQRQAEADLLLREEKYRKLFETMIHGVVYHDAAGQIISVNPAAERILGLTHDQMLGRTSLDPRWHAIHEDGSAFPGETHPSMRALTLGEEVHNAIMGVFNPQLEEYRWINIHAVPEFRAGETQPYRVYTTFEDITERKRAQDRTAEEQNRLASIVEYSEDAIVGLALNGDVLTWNLGAERIFGYTKDQAVGQAITSLIDIQPAEKLTAALREIGQGESPVRLPHLSLSEKMEKKIVSITISLIKGVAEQPIGVSLIAQDVSEQARAKSVREREMRTLEQLSGSPQAVVTAEAFGQWSLSKSQPGMFASLVDRYEEALESAWEQKMFRVNHPIAAELRSMAEVLGQAGAGPRDTIQVHITALKNKSQGVPIAKVQAYAEEGRLLIVELIGYLVLYYRNHCLGDDVPTSSR